MNWDTAIDRQLPNYARSVEATAALVCNGRAWYGTDADKARVYELVGQSGWVTNRENAYLVLLVSLNRDEYYKHIDYSRQRSTDALVKLLAYHAMCADVVDEIEWIENKVREENKNYATYDPTV